MLLGAWLPYARKTGKPFQTIRDVYVRTLETLGFKNSDFESWMPEAKNRYGQRELNIFSTSLLVHTQDQMLNAYTPPSVLTLTKYLNMKSLALRER